MEWIVNNFDGAYAGGNYSLKVIVNEVNTINNEPYDIKNNTSDIYAEIKMIKKMGSGYFNLDGSENNLYINIYRNVFNAPKTFDFRNTNEIILWSGYIRNIPHNDNGTKSISINISFNTGVWQVGSVNFAENLNLRTIPRKSILNNKESFYIQEGIKLNITQYYNGFRNTLVIKENSTNEEVTIDNVVNGQTIISGVNTLLEKTINKIINRNYLEFTFTLYTYNINNLIGTDIKQLIGLIKATNDFVPEIIGNISFDETDSDIIKLTNKKKYIKNFSNIKVMLEPIANLKYNAKISRIVLNNTYNMRIDSTNTNAYYVLDNIKEKNIKIDVIDTRSFSSIIIKTVDNFIEDYYKPIITNVTANRQNGIDETVFLSFDANLWDGNFGNGDNQITECKYRIKQSNSTTWSNYFDILGQVKVKTEGQPLNNLKVKDLRIYLDGLNMNFKQGTSYDIRLYLKDGISNISFNISNYGTAYIDDGYVLDSYYKSSNGYKYAINGIVDEKLDNGLQVHGKIYLNGTEFTGGGDGSGDVTVVDNLTSTSTTSALSANQGRILNQKIEEIEQTAGASITIVRW